MATNEGEPGQLGPNLSTQGHKCAGARPPPPPSLRTKPQTRANPTNSATVSPHKATDAGEPDQLGHRLSAQGRRWSVNQHDRAAPVERGISPARLWSSACAPTWRSVG